MTKREELIVKLRNLRKIHKVKTEEYQKEHNLPDEVGCVTKEGCMIACLYPTMQAFGITLKDIQTET